MRPGSFPQDGLAISLANSSPDLWAVLLVANHVGLTGIRNGPRATVFSISASSSINELWTKPMPDCTSSMVWPGYAPHGVVPRMKPNADQWLTPTVPYRRSAIAWSTARWTSGSLSDFGWTMREQPSVPHMPSLANSTALRMNSTVPAESMPTSPNTPLNASVVNAISFSASGRSPGIIVHGTQPGPSSPYFWASGWAATNRS